MKIPTYDAPQADARALPGVRESSIASPSLFGAAAQEQHAAGRGLMQAGSQISEVAVRMQERENADMVFRAETALKDDYLKFEQDARQNRQGRFAKNLTADTEKWFVDALKKHGEALGNDAQRDIFGKRAQTLRQAAAGSMSRFEAEHLERSHDEALIADKGATVSLAAADPSQVELARATIEGLNRRLAGRKGWEPERLAAENRKDLTLMHVNVLQSLADQNPKAAREYFDANKAEIDGTRHAEIEKVLKHGALKTVAQEFADNLGGMTEAEAIAAARKKYSGEEEEAVVAEVKIRFGEVQQARERAQRDAADAAWQVFGRTGSLKGIPASVLASLDGRDYAALKEHAENKARGRASQTDPGIYYDLRQMAANDPEAFRRLDLRQYVGKLSRGDWEEFVKLQTANPKQAKEAATLTQQLSQTHNTLGWGDKDREKKGAFDRAVTDAIAEAQEGGKALGYAERQAIIDRFIIEGDVNGWLPGGKRRLYEVQGTPEAAKFEPKISDTDKAAIVERFQKRMNRKPTDAEILQTFKTWKGM